MEEDRAIRVIQQYSYQGEFVKKGWSLSNVFMRSKIRELEVSTEIRS
jgi:hypothetical protein